MAAGAGPRPHNRVVDHCASVTDLVLIIGSLVGVVLGTTTALAAWVTIAAAYLVVNAAIMRYRLARHLIDGRAGVLDTLSWVFPSVAGLAGANVAFLALVGHADDGVDGFSSLAVLGVVGIPLSWLLLHVGFAGIYESVVQRAHGSTSPLGFPDESDPGPVEFLYFALTIGATFATSDVEVRTRSMRLLVATHSVIGFFYNAFVVAAAFQVLQRLAEG